MKIDILKTLVTEVPLLVPEAIWLNNNIDLEKILEGNDNTDAKLTFTILLNHLNTNFDKKDMTLEDELYLFSVRHHLKETMEFMDRVILADNEDDDENDDD